MATEADRIVQEEFDRLAVEMRSWTEENLALGGVCDFCASPGREMVTYVAEEQATTLSGIDVDTLGAGSVTVVDDPYWAACAPCAEAIERFGPTVSNLYQADPEGLAAYVIENRDLERTGSIPYETEAILRDSLAETYRRLYAGGIKLGDRPGYVDRPGYLGTVAP